MHCGGRSEPLARSLARMAEEILRTDCGDRVGVLRDDRELDPYLGTLSWLACDGNVTSMLLDDPAGDRESQSGASWVARARGISPVKAIKHMWQVGCWDAHSVITDRQPCIGGVSYERDTDAPACRCVLDCVVEQCEQKLP